MSHSEVLETWLFEYGREYNSTHNMCVPFLWTRPSNNLGGILFFIPPQTNREARLWMQADSWEVYENEQESEIEKDAA